MTARETTADQVRTGDTITNDYARERWLFVDYPTWDRFTNPEGQTLDRIRFTGVDRWGKRVELGYGMTPKGRVYIVEDAPLKADVPGARVFGALADDEPPFNPADLEPFDIDSWELL